MTKIIIHTADISLQAELNDSSTAQQLWDALPVEGRASTWGDEIYFEIPIEMDQAADARAQVEVGELGYWPVGHAFCIFFGPTPASTDDRPRAYSPINPLGRVLGDVSPLRKVKNGTLIQIERDT